MPAYTATAPGKIILVGEHAVVYGQPALAVPVRDVRARAVVRADIKGEEGAIRIFAPGIGLQSRYKDLPVNHPLRVAVDGVLHELELLRTPACSLHIHSTIPIASGLGSSAAVSAAVIQALAGFLGHPLSKERVSSLVFEVEKIHHGTPSGIDNTVVTYDKPVFFTKGLPIQTFSIGKPFTFVIGDTGIPSATAETVGLVRNAYQEDKQRFEDLFSAIGSLAIKARTAIIAGRKADLGAVMDENHTLLKEMGVSSPELDRLVEGARKNAAWGAKLSGGGGGGNMIALVESEQAEQMAQTLKDIGAANTIITRIEPT
ncbi:MAG: mevalonate kinase [Anaerolineales bacterium]